MARFSNILTREWIYTLIHLSVWAQLGVLVRTYLQKFFVLGCSGGWGPCLSGGVYFQVLPPNMLGSFIIGLVATSAMVQIDEQKPVVILGVDHPWQSNAALQVGVRTGLCGSITTFSSWMLEAMTTCLTGNQWLTGIGQMIVGFACAVISFVIGTHMALIIHHKITKAPLENEMLNYSKREADFIFGGGEDPERVVSKELEELEPDLPMQRPLSTTETIGLNYVADIEVEHTTTSESKGVETRAYEAQWIDHVAALSLVLFTIGASFGVAYETEHRWIRNIWLSVLFAPFGCISRWILSKANYRIKYGWDWLPAGTLAANWTGVILDFVLQSIQIRVAPGYWGSLVIDAVETGFCGCLTTVSTLIAEIMKLSELLPFSLRAYVYTTMTFVGACTLGICLLGWVYWT